MNSQIALTKSLEVSPGDIIDVQVYAKYFGTTGGSGNLINFASALTGAFGLSSGSTGEAGVAYDALDDFGSWIAGGNRSDNENWPKGFLNVLIFDKNYNLVDIAYQQLEDTYVQTGTSTKMPHGLLEREVYIEEPGYVYIFLSVEGDYEQAIYFDDLVITHEHSPIVAGADFYPFGMVMDGREITQEDYRWGYQGQYAEEDTTTGWNQFQLRMYDARFGRWLSVDPYGQYASPYVGMGNYPYATIDADGGWSWTTAGIGFAVGAALGYGEGGDLKSALIGGAIGGVAGGLAFKEPGQGFDGGTHLQHTANRVIQPGNLVASIGNFALDNPGLLTGVGRVLLQKEGPDQVDLSGKNDDVFNGLVEWSEYLKKDRTFGVRKRSNGNYFNVHDMAGGLDDDLTSHETNVIMGGGYTSKKVKFSWAIQGQREWFNSTKNQLFHIKDMQGWLQGTKAKPSLRIDFINGKSDLKGTTNSFTFTIHGKANIQKYGKQIFGSRWDQMFH